MAIKIHKIPSFPRRCFRYLRSGVAAGLYFGLLESLWLAWFFSRGPSECFFSIKIIIFYAIVGALLGLLSGIFFKIVRVWITWATFLFLLSASKLLVERSLFYYDLGPQNLLILASLYAVLLLSCWALWEKIRRRYLWILMAVPFVLCAGLSIKTVISAESQKFNASNSGRTGPLKPGK